MGQLRLGSVHGSGGHGRHLRRGRAGARAHLRACRRPRARDGRHVCARGAAAARAEVSVYLCLTILYLFYQSENALCGEVLFPLEMV